MNLAVDYNTFKPSFVNSISDRSHMSSYEKGISAELCATKLLRSKGYSILKNRFKTKNGEIDIIAKKDDNIIAIEVKQRNNLDTAKECISNKQQKRIAKAFLSFISNRNEIFENYRIDMVCLDSVGRFEHIENAFSIEDVISC